MIRMIDLIDHPMFVPFEDLILLLLFVFYLLLSFLLVHHIIVSFYCIIIQDFDHFNLFLIRLHVLLSILDMLIMFMYLTYQQQNQVDVGMKAILDSDSDIFSSPKYHLNP